MLFQGNPVPGDCRLVERQPGLGAVPVNELPNGMVIRFELVDVRLFRTTDFDCSRSGSFKTVVGTRLRLLFAI